LYPFDGRQSSGNQQNDIYDILCNMILENLKCFQKLAKANLPVFLTEDIKI